MNSFNRLAFAFLFGFVALTSCKHTDDTPPIISLVGDTLIKHPLNQIYVDAGATAQDETDGNISKSIYINNPVDVDRTGEYIITYSVVDQAGNEANPIHRTVNVYNQANNFEGSYSIHEEEVFPGQAICDSISFIRIDSNFNYRIVISNFICSMGFESYLDIYDTFLVMPFQIVSDSAITVFLQGSGVVNDSSISLEYTRTINSETSYWQVLLQRND